MINASQEIPSNSFMSGNAEFQTDNSTLTQKQKKVLDTAIKRLQGKFEQGLTDPQALKDDIQAAVYLCENQQLKTTSMESIKADCKYKTLTEIKNKYFSCQNRGYEDAFLSRLTDCLTNHAATLEKMGDIEKARLKSLITSSQLEWSPVKRDEMLRLLMHKCSLERQGKGKSFQGYVIDVSELPAFIQALEMGGLKGPAHKRVQLMVRNEVHYTAVEIEWDPKARKCCIMDAYGEPKALVVEKAFIQAGFQVFTVGTGETVQKDTRSCSIFSLDHLLQSSKRPEFFAFLEQAAKFHPDENVWKISWYDMPARFVRFAQSEDFIRQYSIHNPYMASSRIVINTIESKLAAYNSKVLQLLKDLSDEQVQKIACSHFYSSY